MSEIDLRHLTVSSPNNLEAYRSGHWHSNNWSRPLVADDLCCGCPYLIQIWHPKRPMYGVSLHSVESSCCHPAHLVHYGCHQYHGSRPVGFAHPNQPIRLTCPSQSKPVVGQVHTPELVAACHEFVGFWYACVFAEDGPVELSADARWFASIGGGQ